MTAADGHTSAPDPTVTLYDHAERLHRLTPDAPLPDCGRPLPDQARYGPPRSQQTSFEERRAALRAAFDLPDLAALHDALCEDDIGVNRAATMDLPVVDPARTREVARWLVRHSTDRRPAMAGLLLLARSGRPEDVPLIRMIGLLWTLGGPAFEALGRIGTTADLIWLGERSSRAIERHAAIEKLCERGDPVAVAWLLRQAREDPPMPSSIALAIAEAAGIGEALDTEIPDGANVESAGVLLVAMAAHYDYGMCLGRFTTATRTYALVAAHATRMEPSLERFAMLVTLAEDLCTGHAAHLNWHAGDRRRIVARLRDVLRSPGWRSVPAAAMKSPDPTTRWRAEWAATAVLNLADPDQAPAERAHSEITVHIVVPDPTNTDDVQTRILIDGNPVISRAFPPGPTLEPELLLPPVGGLRATEQRQEVRLAVASCTEGCCGALFVTIVRADDEVVWKDWRRTNGRAPDLPEFRFKADQYDREISHAADDPGWEWPARTLARLLRAELDADPGLLTRWSCQFYWLVARAHQRDQAELSCFYPHRRIYGDSAPWIQLHWVFPAGCTDPADQAADLIRDLRRHDPRTSPYLAGGHREAAERLGLRWPEPPVTNEDDETFR